MPQFMFMMKDLRKVTPQGKEILKGIWLSFYAGAKIGVLGHNGAGKSTLLRIMAGVEKDFLGTARVIVPPFSTENPSTTMWLAPSRLTPSAVRLLRLSMIAPGSPRNVMGSVAVPFWGPSQPSTKPT